MFNKRIEGWISIIGGLIYLGYIIFDKYTSGGNVGGRVLMQGLMSGERGMSLGWGAQQAQQTADSLFLIKISISIVAIIMGAYLVYTFRECIHCKSSVRHDATTCFKCGQNISKFSSSSVIQRSSDEKNEHAINNNGVEKVKLNNLFNGERKIENDKYKIYLVDKYKIKKNDVLNQYVCEERLFATVDEALAHASFIDEEKHKKDIEAQEARATLEKKRAQEREENIKQARKEEAEFNEQLIKEEAAKKLKKELAWKAGATKRWLSISIGATLTIALYFWLTLDYLPRQRLISKDQYNNPKKIQILKPGEDLTSAGERLIGQKITSFGITEDADRSEYESGPIWLTSEFSKKGHPIFNIHHRCEFGYKFNLGASFSDLDCRKGTVEKLVQLASEKGSQIKELCDPVSYDPSQKIIGYVDSSKKIFWIINFNDLKVDAVGVFKSRVSYGEFGNSICSKKSRDQWKSENDSANKPLTEDSSSTQHDGINRLTDTDPKPQKLGESY